MSMFSSVMTAVIVFMFFLHVCVRLGESEAASHCLRALFGKFAQRPLVEKLFILVFVVMMVAHGGSKTNSVPQGGGGNIVAVVDSGTVAGGGVAGALAGDGGIALLTGPESPRLTSNQYAAGFALVRVLTNSAPWLAMPSNAVLHAPWGRYGLAEDTFWLPATNWAFVLGTNAAAGAHVSSSGTLSFSPATPKGSPRAAAMPDGDTVSFLAPLQGSLGTVPPQGRFWHAGTTNNSVLMTWQDLFAGRDTNSPVSFQAELFRNGDFTYRYAFTNAPALTNFAVGAQHNGGGETYAINDTNRLANGLELRWRAFGALDPGVDDHDGDGLSTYDEVMTWGTDPAMPDTDLDGLGDAAETSAGLNPLARDSDGDGIPDGSDPHPLNPSGDTADADGDGLPDAWEARWFGSTSATDSADADTNGDGFSDRANLLSGANPAFAACAVTASGGSHTFTWTVLPDATNYAAAVTRGGAAVWSCLTNVCLLSVTGDFSTAVHTLTVTSYGGVTSRTASVTFRQPSQPNLTVWKIADPFALELPQGCTNVLERSFRINRSAAWQQYFVSSGHDSAGAWSLDGLRLDWSDSGGGSGSASASPAGDSLRLAVSTSGPQSLTVRIVPDGAGGLARSPKPLYLLGWSPAVAFSSTGAVLVASSNGVSLVAVSDRGGGATAVSFTVDRGGRPCGAAPGADEIVQQSGPFGPGSGASFSGTYDSGGNLTGGAVTAGDPGGFPLPNPAGGGGGSGGGGSSQPPPPPPPPGSPPSTLCLISPVVTHRGRTTHCGCDYYGTDSYPFDSACLREAWWKLGGCWEDDSEADGFSVTLGADALDARFTVSINGVARSSHTWDDGESTAHASVALDGMDVWGTDVERETYIPGGFCVYSWGDGECGDCNGCENGDCSQAEGENLGSVRFRIPLGFTGLKQMAGFVWFHLETPQAITPAAFTVTGDASVRTEHANAGGALSRAYSDAPGGRDVRFAPAAGGVRVSVRDTGDAAEDRAWLITSDAGSVSFLKTDSAANTELNVTYAQPWPGYWVRTDNATGLTKARTVSGGVTNDVEVTQDIARDAASRVLSGRRSSRTLVGAGPAAVVREIQRGEWDGAAQTWRETRMTWWADSLNPLLNGRPKFKYGDGGDWEYRAHDARGRETLRAEPLDGSAHPFFKDDAEPFAFSPAASYASLTGLVTVTSYAPAPGDGDALNDSRKPREVSVYAVRGGAPSLVSREWRVYARATNGVWQTVTQRVIRAASPAAGPDDAANARTLTVAYAGDDDAVPALLRGRPLREERGDGALLTWEYDLNAATLTVTARRGTAAHPDGLANVSTYEVETFDAVFGRALGRETRLYAGAAGGVPLASETMTYDAQGRLLATAYSDGTSESNVWGCCRLEAKIGRGGRRTDYLAVPGNSHWSVAEETSLGGLPGAGGSHPAAETFTDALGRETNSVRCVWRNGSRDSAYAPLATRTGYPFGTDNHVVTTDPLGVQTVTRTYYEGNAEITEAASAGVTNRTIRVRGGATVEEKFWDGKWTRETRSTAYDAAGRRAETVTAEASDCPAFAKTVTTYDFLGREVSVAAPLGVTSNFYDGASDRVVRMSRTGSPDTIYVYDALGNVTAAALDVDGDGQVSYAGSDRISATATRYEEDASNVWWRVTSSAVWSQTGSDACLTAGVTRVRMTGLGGAAPARISANAILTAQSQTLDAHGNATLNSMYADAGSASAWQVTESPFSTQAVIRVSKAGVPATDISASCVTNTYAYDGFARRTAATDGRGNTSRTVFNSLGQAEYTADAASNRTAYAYDGLGRQVAVSSPLSNTVHTAYDSLGNVIRSWGAAYPVEYGYDTRGRKISMKTFRVENGNGDETRWLYDNATGLLTNKVYADGKGTAYGYTSSGRLSSRIWARGVTTGYAYDAFGQLTDIDYSDATPDVAFAYDRLGRMTSATTPVSTNLFEYAGFDLLAETQNGVTITRSYDDLGRSAGFNMGSAYVAAYGYDAFGRIAAVSSSVATASSVATYAYVPGTDLVAAMTNSSGFAWSRAYEQDRDLIASVENDFAANLISAYAYANDADGRRTLRIDSTPALSVTNAFDYNIRAEVTNAVIGTSTFGYGYDDIGNRLVSSVNAVSSSFTANNLNQYTEVNGSATVTPVYDADGNMLTNGVWAYTWDGENRMACAVSNGVMMVTSIYDHMSRRIIKIAGENQHTFTYDSWCPVRETSSSMNGVCTNHYVWGLDLSGSLQGAGGVGGLLVDIKDGVPYFPCYDANGNVTEYVDANGTMAAHRAYSAFGQTTSLTGPLAGGFCFWWSTKPWCPVTGLSEYEFRKYHPDLGRWLSEDPIGEEGGLLLYAAMLNDPINRVDFQGLSSSWWECTGYCASYHLKQMLNAIAAIEALVVSAEGMMEIPITEKAINSGTERLTSLGNKIFQRINSASGSSRMPSAVKSALKQIAEWAKTSGSMKNIPGLRSKVDAVRRFAKGGRTVLRMARGGIAAGAVIAVGIESYCMTACCRQDTRDEFENLMNTTPEDFLGGEIGDGGD